MKLIMKIVSISKQLTSDIKIAYLENYDIELGKMLVFGIDLWLNTPRKPLEASGTSGMKAAHNGVPSLSILDGWWIEGCIEEHTGWAISSAHDTESIDQENLILYMKSLKRPLFLHSITIAINGLTSCVIQ